MSKTNENQKLPETTINQPTTQINEHLPHDKIIWLQMGNRLIHTHTTREGGESDLTGECTIKDIDLS